MIFFALLVQIVFVVLRIEPVLSYMKLTEASDHDIKWLNFTHRCIYFVLIDDILFAIAYIYNGNQAASNGSFSLRYGACAGLNAGSLQHQNGNPKSSSFANMYFSMTSFIVVDFIILLAFYLFQLQLQNTNIKDTQVDKKAADHIKKDLTTQEIYTFSHMKKNALPESALLCLYFYAYVNKLAITEIIRYSYYLCFYQSSAFTISVDDELNSTFDYFVAISYLTAFGFILLPPLFLILIGPDTIFKVTCEYMSYYFERNSNELENIGGWMAQLLESVDVEKGKVWYVSDSAVEEHRLNARSGFSTDSVSHPLLQIYKEPKWFEGTISDISDNDFSVTLKKYPEITINVPRKASKSFSELQKEANTKFVSWDSIRSIRDVFYKPCHEYSEKLSPNTEIDYFISHAWADDDDKQRKYLKFSALESFAESHREQNGEYPTFWLDRCCLDTVRLEDSFKMLPVNIMKCKKMIILYGENYFKRLWCVWELLTLFALDESLIVDKLVILPVNDRCDFISDIKKFDVRNAEAWEPNDCIRLNEVISALGIEEFNNKVRSLATKLKQNDSVRSMNARLNYLRNAVESNTERLQLIDSKVDQLQLINSKMDKLLSMMETNSRGVASESHPSIRERKTKVTFEEKVEHVDSIDVSSNNKVN